MMDLFEDEKRLGLAPVKALSKCAVNAFAAGPCRCIRCKEGQGVQTGYIHLHTFEVAGEVFSRRFACSSHSEVRSILAKAWEAYYKTDLPEHGIADMPAIMALGNGETKLLGTLLYAAGVVKDVEGVTHFAAGAF